MLQFHKFAKNSVFGISGVVLGVFLNFLCRNPPSLPENRVASTVSQQEARSAFDSPAEEKRLDRSQSDKLPDNWKWTAQKKYSTFGSGGRITRDALRIAGLSDEDGPKVKAVFNQAFLRVEQEMAMHITKKEESGINCYEIKGDQDSYERNMKSLRTDLINQFGNSAARILYQGFHPGSKYGGMGKTDLRVETRGEIHTENGDLAEGVEAVDRFRIKHFNSSDNKWEDSAVFPDVEILRDKLGNLVDMLK